MTEYLFVQLHQHAKCVDPINPGRGGQKTVLFDAFGDADGKGERKRRITREGDTLTIACAKTGRAVDLPWSNVAFSRPMALPAPKVETRPEEPRESLGKVPTPQRRGGR